jgi:hypothetical protein
MGRGRKVSEEKSLTYVSGAAIVANTFVKLDSNGEVVTCGDGEEAKGVALNAATAQGENVEVSLQNSGNVVRVLSSTTIANGAVVASDAAGKAITSASGKREIGQADEGGSATDKYSIIHLTRGGTTA